jgi:hypothetical protein
MNKGGKFLKQLSSELVLVNTYIERDGVATKESVSDYYPYTNSIFLNFIKNRFTGCQMAIKRSLHGSKTILIDYQLLRMLINRTFNQ